MKDALLEGTHQTTILAGDSPDAYNDVEAPAGSCPTRRWWHSSDDSLTVVQMSMN
jgi:hypothetical protein